MCAYIFLLQLAKFQYMARIYNLELLLLLLVDLMCKNKSFCVIRTNIEDWEGQRSIPFFGTIFVPQSLVSLNHLSLSKQFAPVCAKYRTRVIVARTKLNSLYVCDAQQK